MENASDDNLTESEYLAKVLGPKYLPMEMVVPLTLTYVVIFVTGIFGNVVTCTVIMRNTSMQSATNYYLFSLAISDLTLLILGLPNELGIFWQQYPWALGVGLCKIRAYVSEMSSYVSVLTIVAFSMERYLAICHPLRVYARSGLKRPLRFILAAWSIAVVSAIPFAIYTTVNYVEYPPGSGNYSSDSAICAMLLPDMPRYPIYETSCAIFFLVPMLVILLVYIKMGLKIRSGTKDALGKFAHSAIHGDARRIQSRKPIIRMLSAVVIMFFVCWAPFHAQRLLYVYAQESDYYPDLNEWLYILSGCLYYFSTTVNPILYNLMSIKYRTAFKQTICGKRGFRGSYTISEIKFCECPSGGIEKIGKSTIDKAKGLLRKRDDEVDAKRNVNVGKRCVNCKLRRIDSSSKALLGGGKHPIAHQRTSSESATSRSRIDESPFAAVNFF